MRTIDLDEGAALVDITLDGPTNTEESKLPALSYGGCCRRHAGARSRLCDEFRGVPKFGSTLGLDRVAQVVESSVVLLQRSRIMRESGTDPLTRTFRDRVAARRWLLSRSETR